MSLVYVVRHGNTFDKGDVVRRVGGRTDLPLSTSGHMQAECLAEHFAHIDFGRVYASKLKRQYETAQVILNAQEQALEIETLEFLREIDYGPDENRPEADVISRIGEVAMAGWELHARPPKGWKVNPDAIRRGWAEFFGAQRDVEKPTLLVTSNGTARFILDVTSHKTDLSRKLRTGAYGIVNTLGKTPYLMSWDMRPTYEDGV